jgi:hypothetical protein
VSKTSIAIKDENGKVLVGFFEEGEPVKWCDLDPETARQASEAMARAAYTARFGVAPAEGRSVIAESKRAQLVTRVALVLRQLQQRGREPIYTAQQLVDIVLSGVS